MYSLLCLRLLVVLPLLLPAGPGTVDAPAKAPMGPIELSDVAAGIFQEPHGWGTESDSAFVWSRFPAELVRHGNGAPAEHLAVWTQATYVAADSDMPFFHTGLAVSYTNGSNGVLVLFRREASTGELREYWRSQIAYGSSCRCHVVDLDQNGDPEFLTVWISRGARWWYQNLLIYDITDSASLLISPLSSVGFPGTSLLMGRDFSLEEDDEGIVIQVVRTQDAPDASPDHRVQTLRKVSFRWRNGTAVIDSSDAETHKEDTHQ